MSNFDYLLSKVPGFWNTEVGSNNYNAIKLVAQLEDDLDLALKAIYDLWHIDTSYGQGLDDLGKDLGLPRNGLSDDEYRKFLKVKEMLDNSNGTISDIDTILSAFLEGHYRGLKEGWNSDLLEPSSIILEVTKNASSLPFEVAKSAKSGGVRVYYEALFDDLVVTLYSRDYEYINYYPITNIHEVGYKKGLSQKDKIVNKSNNYSYVAYKTIAGSSYCGGYQQGIVYNVYEDELARDSFYYLTPYQIIKV